MMMIISWFVDGIEQNYSNKNGIYGRGSKIKMSKRTTRWRHQILTLRYTFNCAWDVYIEIGRRKKWFKNLKCDTRNRSNKVKFQNSMPFNCWIGILKCVRLNSWNNECCCLQGGPSIFRKIKISEFSSGSDQQIVYR